MCENIEINGGDDGDDDVPAEPRPTRRDVLKAASTISRYIDDLDDPCYAPSFIFVSRASLSRHVYYRPVSFDLPDYFRLCRYLDI